MRLHGDQKKGHSGYESRDTHLKLESPHLRRAAITDNDAMGTEGVLTKDVLSECFSGALGVGTWLLGE